FLINTMWHLFFTGPFVISSKKRRFCSRHPLSICQFIHALIGRTSIQKYMMKLKTWYPILCSGLGGQMPLHICFDIMILYAYDRFQYIQFCS
uniref:Uncharacterized protein n=1 Tax=Aegilops tauschii subsp. strangulata TaxID=200361 RepID=A0A453Q6R5_AEGTS